MEGTRPLLVEIQALVAPSSLGTPRRAVVGWDTSRLSMILAVLEARCGVSFGKHDVYLNIAGGLKVSEPAADLAAAAALLSSMAGVALPQDEIYVGEVSLSGAIQPYALAPERSPETGLSARRNPRGRRAGYLRFYHRNQASSAFAGLDCRTNARVAGQIAPSPRWKSLLARRCLPWNRGSGQGKLSRRCYGQTAWVQADGNDRGT
jgi:DNA repair protein RadA/Sms